MGKVLRAAAIVGAFFVNPYAGLVAFQSLGGAQMLGLGPKRPKIGDQGFRSRASVDPQALQWIIVGQTAAPAKMIHADTQGATNDVMSQVFVHACHPINGIVALYLNNTATTYSPSVAGDYAGVLTIQTADGTQSANPFTSVAGGRWGASHKGQGLAMSHFRWTYDAEKLAAGLPQNIQFVVKGIKVYDPRRDTTVGGSGSHRADDETTWAYSAGGTDIGRNPALVELTYRLGWKKNGRLWAGMGEDPANIDYASYIAAANVCEESVNSKQRYCIDGMLSLGASHNENLARIHAACAGRSIDQGGLIAFWAANDDTGSAVMTLGADQFKSDIAFQPLPDGERRNTGRGTFVDPASFYQAMPYTEVQPASAYAQDNSIEQADDLSFDVVQDVDQARRLTSIRIMESRQGPFQVTTDLSAIKLRPIDVVEIDHDRWSWSGKTFRVESWGLTPDWKVQLSLSAVASADYADLANVSTSSAATLAPTGFVPAPGEEYATRGGNLLFNNLFAGGSISGWTDVNGDLGSTMVSWVRGQSGLPPAPAEYGIEFQSEASGQRILRHNAAISLSAGEKLFVEIWAGAAAALAPNLELNINATLTLNDGTTVGVTLLSADETTVTPGLFQRYTNTYTVPAGAVSMVVQIDNGATAGHWLWGVPWIGRQQPGADVTTDQPVVGLLSPTTGRGTSRRLAGQFAGSGVDRLISTNPLSASTDGGGVATITINAHDEIDDAGTLSFTSSSIGGLSASTTYYIYEDNADYAAGARSYVATTTRANLAAAGRRYVGTITTPAAGGAGTGGTGGTGGGWGGGGGDIP